MSYGVAALAVVGELDEDEDEDDDEDELAAFVSLEVEDEDDELLVLSSLPSPDAFAVVSAVLFFSRLSVR
jgi:hypothetical protein